MQSARTQTSGAAATIAIALASAPSAGDLLVAGVGYQGPAATMSAPGGWTIIDDVASGAIGQTTLYHVVQSGESGSYTFYARHTVPMTIVVQEVAGISAASPIATSAPGSAAGGLSSTTGTLTASNVLPLAFFTQFCNGLQPNYYNGGGWTGQYTVTFATGYAIAEEAQYGPVSSTAVSASETWQGGNSGAQVNDLVLVNTGPIVTPSPSPTPKPSPTPSPTPTPTPTPVPTPTATLVPVTPHVLSMAFYGEENSGLSASFMAQNVTMVEIAAGSSLGDNFIAAGGTNSILYTDPHLVPFCTGNICRGPMGNTTPESAWLHSSSGARLATSDSQDALDPMSTSTQGAFRNYVNQYASGTRTNMVIVDDMLPTYESSYFQYKFGYDAVEYTTQSAWYAGQLALLASSSQPVIYNGGDGDAPDISMMTAPNVAGRMVESCVVTTTNRVNDTQGNPVNRWAPDLNKLLAATTRGRYAICLNYGVSGGNALGDRLYGMASTWLVYDPIHSIAFPDYNTSDGNKIFPENQIVPRGPLQTAGSDVANLRTSGGAYVREFSACFQNGTAIGHCAAVVNPSYGSSVPMPALSQSYTRSLTMGSASLAAGGVATWVASSLPNSLPAETGIILLQ